MGGKETACQLNGEGADRETMEQDAIDREVLKDIWNQEGNDWSLQGVLEEPRNRKQIEKPK